MDVPYLLLYYSFEESDERVAQLATEYCEGLLLSGELKQLATERISDFLMITETAGRRSVRSRRNCLHIG